MKSSHHILKHIWILIQLGDLNVRPRRTRVVDRSREEFSQAYRSVDLVGSLCFAQHEGGESEAMVAVHVSDEKLVDHSEIQNGARVDPLNGTVTTVKHPNFLIYDGGVFRK